MSSLYYHGTAQQKRRFPVKPTLAALPSQPTHFEVADGVLRHSGEFVNGLVKEQGSLARRESEPFGEDQPCSGINQIIGTAHRGSGEATEESELHTTDTNRRGAGKEAQVDPDTAQDPAGADTPDSRDLPAEGRDENNTERVHEDLDDAIERPRRHRPELCGESDKAQVDETDVVSPVHHGTIANNGGGQNNCLYEGGPASQNIHHLDDVDACPATKVVSGANRRQSSRHFGREVSYVYEDPLATLKLRDIKGETPPTNTAIAVLPMNKEHASRAPGGPSEIKQ